MMMEGSSQRVRCESCRQVRVCHVEDGFLVCSSCASSGSVDRLVVEASADGLVPVGAQMGLW